MAGTAEGMIVDTVAYMSPEQAQGKPLDARSDRIKVDEIARKLAVSIPTAYAMLRDHQIPNIRRGKLYIVSREAFGRWLATCGLPSEVPQ